MNKLQNFRIEENTDRLIEYIKNLDKTIYNEKVVFGIALYKKEDKLKPSFCKIDFLRRDETLPPEITYHYDDFVIVKKNITIQTFYDILEKIKNGSEVELFSGLKSLIKVNNWETSYVFSNQDWGYLDHEYAGMYYQARFPADVDGFIPNYPLIAKDYPPFPNGSLALGHIFKLNHHGWGGLDRLFLIEVPDYRAKIKSVKISNKRVIVETESKFINPKDLRLQLYISGKGFTTTNSNQVLTKGKAKIILDDEAEIILVVLQTKTGEIIDKKEVNLNYVPTDSSIKIEIPSYQIQETISMGEGKHIEFKSKLENPERFVRSVVGFGNAEGGRIFIGVDNEGGIVRAKEFNKTKDTIMNWIAEYCDPRIDVNIKYSSELEIIIVEVPTGNQKPYFLKNEGVFIRHGGTNRHVSKAELDSMTRKENPPTQMSII